MSTSQPTASQSPLPRALADRVPRRTLLTAGTAGALTLLYGLYAAVVSPLVSPDGITRGDERVDYVPPPPRNSVRMAERFLPFVPWAANAKYQLRTEEAYVYFEEWDRVDAHEAVRFRPFALVWIHDDDAADTPITIVADSAFVKFASKFEITNNPGRVVAGALEGRTQIRGPNEMFVEGRNFTYSESAMRIWSDNAIDFEYGRSAGSAIGLQIELLPDPDPDDSDSLLVSGMQKVRLRRNVDMDLATESDADTDIGGPAATDDGPQRVHVTSDGSFDYDVERLVASFEDNVKVVRPVGSPDDADEHTQTLDSDRLTLVFEPDPEKQDPKPDAAEADDPESAAPEPAEESRNGFRMFETNLAFRSMQAEGETVRLVAADNGLQATGRRMDFDAQTRVAVLSHEQAVRVLHEGSELRSPKITLVQNADGELESVTCDGAGWMKHREAETGTVDFESKWDRRMRIHPDAATGLELVELEGEAVVRQTREQSAMQAEYVRLWFERTPENGGPSGSETESSEADGSKADADDSRGDALLGGGRNARPKRMLAVEDVIMISPDLITRTKELEVLFEDAVGEPAPATPVGQSRRRPRRREEAVTRAVEKAIPLRPLVPAPRRRAGHVGQAMASTDDPVLTSRRRRLVPGGRGPEDGPLNVTADQVRVRVLEVPDSDDVHVAEVWTTGNVHVTQKHGPEDEPLDVVGERLHIVNRGEGREILHVYGRPSGDETQGVPARIRDRGMRIEGAAIHLDRGANRAWVDGRGLLEIPVSQDLEGNDLDEPLPLDVWWQEAMQFDGRTARFVGEVKTVLDDNRMDCAEMDVVFDRRIRFDQESEEGEDPQIHRVVCKDGVRLESYAWEDSKLAEVRRARFWEFSLNQSTGDTLARGPGVIEFWRRGSGRRAGLTPTKRVTANQPLSADSSEWEYTRIDFTGRTEGNVNRRTTTFGDRVEVVYGPVDHALQRIDIDELPEDGGWMRSRSLRVTQYEAGKERPAYVTLLAEGDVELEGRTFHARADAVSFDESKELYTLRAKGRQDATIWRQKEVGGRYDGGVNAKRLEFVPSRNELRIDRASGASGGN